VVGYEKPDVRLFQYCLQKANAENIPRDRILMVGNETEADIAGANSMNFKSVLLTSTEDSSGGAATWDISELHELRKIIFQ
jgi:FMN phosphatase YigB (HAD superfamily)